MAEIFNNQWRAGENDFATRIEIADLTGFFSKTLVIEPGVVAMFLENGQSIGNARNGHYNLQSLSDKLSFWNRKSISTILARDSEVFIELSCDGISTSEFLEVEISVRIGVRIEDVALFQKNLMGSKANLTTDDIRNIIFPIVRQGLWEGVSRMSIQELVTAQSRGDLELCIGQSLGTSLIRMGLQFSQVQTLAISHPEYDEHLRRIGESWLLKQSNVQDQADADDAAKLLKTKIANQGRIDELELLGKKVAADRLEGELALKIKRIGIRKALNQALQASQFDDLLLQQNLEKFQTEQEKERILRQDELHDLAEILNNKTEDRDTKRRQILKKLEIEQQSELAALRIDLDASQLIRTRKHELLLAEINDSEDARQWREHLQKEAESAEKRRVESLKQVNFDREIAISQATYKRDQELTDLLHNQQIQRQSLEIEIERTQRQQRISIIQIETRKSQHEADLELRRREETYDLEHRKARSDQQLDRLSRIQEMNQQALEKESRLKAELDLAKADSEHSKQVEKLRMAGSLSTEALIATSETSNAAILVDLKKHEASQNATYHQQDRANAEKLNEERLNLYKQMNEAEKAKADAIAEAYKMAMQAQAGTVNQVVSGFSQAARPQSYHSEPPPPPPPPVESWYVVVNGEKIGPTSFSHMRQYILEGRIRLNTLVWKTGMPSWVPAENCPELVSVFGNINPFSGGPPPLP